MRIRKLKKTKTILDYLFGFSIKRLSVLLSFFLVPSFFILYVFRENSFDSYYDSVKVKTTINGKIEYKDPKIDYQFIKGFLNQKKEQIPKDTIISILREEGVQEKFLTQIKDDYFFSATFYPYDLKGISGQYSLSYNKLYLYGSEGEKFSDAIKEPNSRDTIIHEMIHYIISRNVDVDSVMLSQTKLFVMRNEDFLLSKDLEEKLRTRYGKNKLEDQGMIDSFMTIFGGNDYNPNNVPFHEIISGILSDNYNINTANSTTVLSKKTFGATVAYHYNKLSSFFSLGIDTTIQELYTHPLSNKYIPSEYHLEVCKQIYTQENCIYLDK